MHNLSDLHVGLASHNTENNKASVQARRALCEASRLGGEPLLYFFVFISLEIFTTEVLSHDTETNKDNNVSV
ncbi:hypothetical protein A9Q74_13495 [Colwellia sp. 39_35_sub15_T18]|nr:hypothetical protein A9Q74_13495 [Colwellia sp. 39_35_sub15_T18]